MSESNIHKGEKDEKTQALLSNANAARLLAQTIEGTIGPKGLDIMMVGSLGDVVISNDGVTILKLMAVNHPVARMIINAARAQQEQVGDGTTTATILAGTLVAEGANHVIKGVPVTQIIEGIRLGVEWSVQLIEQHSRSIDSVDDPVLFDVAVTAGRGQKDIASLVLEGARIVGQQNCWILITGSAMRWLPRKGLPVRCLRGLLLIGPRLIKICLDYWRTPEYW